MGETTSNGCDPASFRDTCSSESDNDIRVVRSSRKQRKRIIIESSSSDSDTGSILIVTRSGSPRAHAKVPVSDTAGILSDTSTDRYDIGKHYDNSLGSLRDFIVDDTESFSEGLPSDTDSVSSVSPASPERSGPDLPDLARLSISKQSSSTAERRLTLDREELASRTFNELNLRVFGGMLSNVKIEWSKRLLTTAGQAECKRFVQSLSSADSRTRIGDDQPRMILSDKVLTGEIQIVNTVAHEMCHCKPCQ
jgi:hypothetical protein